MTMSVTVGMNGFGRFGQHLLKYWLENAEKSKFIICYINDSGLTLGQAYKILTTDKYYTDFFKSNFTLETDGLSTTINGDRLKIYYTNVKDENINWLGKPDLFFECSGKNTDAPRVKKFIKNNTRLAIISATSLNSDRVLVYGHNHKEFKADHTIVSYGSCTVNAFVPLASFIHRVYGVIDSSVDVIHNVPEYILASQNTLSRKPCTLEVAGPQLLDFITVDNFNVNYTSVPYSGVSIIDFRFRLKTITSTERVIKVLKNAMNNGELHKLYRMDLLDSGPEDHKFSSYSADLIEADIRLVGDNLYIQAYFDNENSVNRYYDLVQHTIQVMG
jgi:glyceraldehyde 3-phosphate dehydrogenase